MFTQSLCHLPAPDISHGMQGQTVVQFIKALQVLGDGIDDEVYQIMFLVQEQGDSEIADLFLGVCGGGDQIDGFEVAEIDIVALDVDVEQLAHVLFLLVPVEVAALEVGADVCELFVHPFFLDFSRAGVAEIAYELDQAAHR